MPSAGGDSIKVAVRVRPFNQREINRQSKCVISMNGGSTTIAHPISGETKQFTFDYSYWSHDGFIEQSDGQLDADDNNSKYADQRTVFNDLGQGVLQNAWDGYNATLFAYGQTGSGKSYSMIGHGSNKGIVPITCGELFQAIDKVKANEREIQVTFSMLEIYNEQTRDLLCNKNSQNSRNLKVRENRNVGFYVEGLSQHPCRDYSAIERMMEIGTINRTTAATNMNATSSRSHMVITIKFKQIFNNKAGQSTTKTSEINLVDLAGSERAESSGATGDRLKEGSAINTSLLMLGTVIETLAAGDQRAVVPYRGSVLTKLLKSALGGNSKTVMIAALSPADINYDETMSTLRYANRAKKIKNQAVVNENPTDKLIRQLKEENARLLAQLSGHSPLDGLIDNVEVERLIARNEQQMKEMMMSWEQKLESARKQWEAEQKKSEEKHNHINHSYPYLQNVNEDPQLSGIIKHFIYDGITVIGRCSKIVHDHMNIHCIVLRGLGIQEEHCSITSIKDNNVTIEPCESSHVIVNGMKVLGKTILNHGDRLKIGSNALFLYVGFPNQRRIGSNELDATKLYDFDFFQNELMANAGINHDIGSPRHDSGTEHITDAVYLEYIHLMPVVAGVNAMSEELDKDTEFSLLVKNLAAYDEHGREMIKELVVMVRHQVTNQIWIWSKNKFINRRYMMEELYMKYQDDPSVITDLSRDHDPFWDPVEDVYLGCAHVWLHSLAYCMSFDDQVAIHNYSGDEEGLLQISLSSCSPTGDIKGDESMIIDPNELLGQRFDLIINIQQCLGLKWIRQNSTRGVMLRFKFFEEQNGHQSRAIWHSLNPKLAMKQKITVESVDKTFLQYLHSAALVVQLWGLQAGRIERPNSPQDSGFIPRCIDTTTTPPSSPSNSSASSDVEALERELLKTKHKLKETDDDNRDLRKICNILKKENSKLKKKLQTNETDRNGISSTLPKPTTHQSHLRDSNSNSRSPAGNKVQAELGKALKSFFSDIRPVQRGLRIIRTCADFQDNTKVEEVSQDLDTVLTSLRDAVSSAVRIHKMERKSSVENGMT